MAVWQWHVDCSVTEAVNKLKTTVLSDQKGALLNSPNLIINNFIQLKYCGTDNNYETCPKDFNIMLRNVVTRIDSGCVTDEGAG